MGWPKLTFVSDAFFSIYYLYLCIWNNDAGREDMMAASGWFTYLLHGI